MQLTNVTVSDAKMVKQGEGEKGPWELWNLTINGQKYSKFRGKNEELTAGLEIAYMEYEETTKIKDGKEYKNLTIKKLEWAAPAEPKQEPTLTPLPRPKNGELPYSMKMSYVKDVACTLLSRNIPLNEFSSHLAIVWKAVEDVTNGEQIPF